MDKESGLKSLIEIKNEQSSMFKRTILAATKFKISVTGNLLIHKK